MRVLKPKNYPANKKITLFTFTYTEVLGLFVSRAKFNKSII